MSGMCEEVRKAKRADVLAGLDAARSATLARLIGSALTTPPVVTSFAIDDLTISEALALPANAVAPAPRRRFA